MCIRDRLLSGRPIGSPGTIVIPCLEGTRPVLIELQALVSTTNFGLPRRMATGIDYNRVVLLMAIMEKRLGMQLQNQDAYVNIVGGLRVDEPAVDLGVIIAIASSFRDQEIDPSLVAIGEVGLTCLLYTSHAFRAFQAIGKAGCVCGVQREYQGISRKGRF